MGWPEGEFTLHAVRADSAGSDAQVELLGHGPVPHRINAERQIVIDPVAVTLTIEPRQGTYARMPLQRDCEVWIHSRPAKKLAINGTQAAADYDPLAKATRIAVQEDAGRKAAIRLQCEF